FKDLAIKERDSFQGETTEILKTLEEKIESYKSALAEYKKRKTPHLSIPVKFSRRLKMKQGASKLRVWSFSVLALTVPLAACSSEEPASQPPQAATSTEAPAVQVPSPKDATAVEPCSMLPEQTAAELGLKAKGRSAHEGSGCRWNSEDLSRNVSLTALPDRSIQEFRDGKDAYMDYGELTIAGHPAVRANQSNPSEDGFCDIFLAVNDNQVLHAAGRDSSYTDPCGLAQKALEAAVSNLPAAN